ncbi:hypothetical protein HJFPF1_01580 [Paramyrothecium foliicola]|nr:hypothetical protein HJFPF1_01580 [Paramyrothecium foliicola]
MEMNSIAINIAAHMEGRARMWKAGEYLQLLQAGPAFVAATVSKHTSLPIAPRAEAIKTGIPSGSCCNRRSGKEIDRHQRRSWPRLVADGSIRKPTAAERGVFLAPLD